MASDRTYMPRKKPRPKRAMIDARGQRDVCSRRIGALGAPGRFVTYGLSGKSHSKIHHFA